MTLLDQPQPTQLRMGSCAAILRAIAEPAVTLAVWTRPPPPGLVAAADALVRHAPLTAIAEDRPDRAAARVAAALPVGACARTRIAADIARLGRLFADLLGAAAVRVRLEAIDGPACRLFHADHVALRLLCTYAGPGTEWVPDEAVDRRRLGDNGAAIRTPSAVRRLPRFAVGLFKGEAWPGNAGRGVVHRSAPADPSRPRLLLCLDEAGRF